MALGDRHPVVGAGAAQRVDAERAGPTPRIASRSITACEVADVRARGSRAARPSARRSARLHAVEPGVEQRVRLALDPAGDVGVGRPAVRRVVLEAAVAGRVVRRRDDDPVGGAAAAAAVVGEDRVRDHRRRRRRRRGRRRRRRRRGRPAPRGSSRPPGPTARACRARGTAVRRSPAPRGSGTRPR